MSSMNKDKVLSYVRVNGPYALWFVDCALFMPDSCRKHIYANSSNFSKNFSDEYQKAADEDHRLLLEGIRNQSQSLDGAGQAKEDGRVGSAT